MQFEQAYYTSCRSGLEGGSGFQVQAASGGITPADYPELGRVGGCHLFSPGQIESPNNSPFSISYLPGRGDYSYLCRSVDTGKDSYGRPGQFFTHILRARSHREDFWHWLIPPMAGRGTFWAASPAPTPLLPPLSGTALRVDGGWKSLMLGLKDCPNPGRFALWLEAAFRSLEQGEKLITALRENHFALLLTALMAALPRSLARSISFCTYSADPFGEDVLICSTSPEGLHGYDFAHYPGFRLVNFLEPNDKSAIGEISPLAVFLAEALHQGDLGAVMAWQQFLAPLDFTFRAEDLRVIFQAFQKTQTRKGRPFTRAGQKMIHPQKAAKAPAVRRRESTQKSQLIHLLASNPSRARRVIENLPRMENLNAAWISELPLLRQVVQSSTNPDVLFLTRLLARHQALENLLEADLREAMTHSCLRKLPAATAGEFLRQTLKKSLRENKETFLNGLILTASADWPGAGKLLDWLADSRTRVFLESGGGKTTALLREAFKLESGDPVGPLLGEEGRRTPGTGQEMALRHFLQLVITHRLTVLNFQTACQIFGEKLWQNHLFCGRVVDFLVRDPNLFSDLTDNFSGELLRLLPLAKVNEQWGQPAGRIALLKDLQKAGNWQTLWLRRPENLPTQTLLEKLREVLPPENLGARKQALSAQISALLTDTQVHFDEVLSELTLLARDHFRLLWEALLSALCNPVDRDRENHRTIKFRWYVVLTFWARCHTVKRDSQRDLDMISAKLKMAFNKQARPTQKFLIAELNRDPQWKAAWLRVWPDYGLKSRISAFFTHWRPPEYSG